MTEVEKVTLTPLQTAVHKNSVSAVAVALIEERGGETSLDSILEFLGENGMQNDKSKVYASVQTLATHGKIDRGLVRGTYAPAGSVDATARDAAKALRSESAKIPRAKKEGNAPAKTYTNVEVLEFLIEQLGEPRKFEVGVTWGPTFVLLGEASGEQILERAKISLGVDPVSWTQTAIGGNVSVMFLQD